jgi:hypothetical protein
VTICAKADVAARRRDDRSAPIRTIRVASDAAERFVAGYRRTVAEAARAPEAPVESLVHVGVA